MEVKENLEWGEKWNGNWNELEYGIQLEEFIFNGKLAYADVFPVTDSYLAACTERLTKQDSRYSEWSDSFDCGI